MLEQIKTVVEEDCSLSQGAPVLVAVSGGPDSLCLLDILQHLGYTLVIAHLDHGLRPNSANEANTIRLLAAKLGLPFVISQVSVPEYADQHGLSIEEAARTVRYNFLFEQAALHNVQAVAVGHTADDQVETVLMHLLRGSGLTGLTGMSYRSLPNAWSQEIPLIRPLLGIWRKQIHTYIVEHELQPIFDESNWDTRFHRNRLRHELIPYLEKYNPRIQQALWRTAHILAAEETLIQNSTDIAWQACTMEHGVGYIAFHTKTLASQPIAVQRRIILHAIRQLRPGLRDLDFATIDRALHFLAQPSHNAQQVDLIAGLRLLVEEDRLWLASWEADLPQSDWPQMMHAWTQHLDVPGTLSLPGKWKLLAIMVEDLQTGRELALANLDPYQAWLDAEQLNYPLMVRARRPGDRINPLGMAGHSLKLSDLMINAHLSRRARDSWPLIVSENEIAWVPGLRLGHSFRVRQDTRKIVHLQLTNKKP